VVPRDVDPQNFIYVPETRKVRNVGWAKCFYIPLLIFLIVGGVLGVAGYFLHQYSQGEGLLEWPAGTLIGKSGTQEGVELEIVNCYNSPGDCHGHDVQNDDNDKGDTDLCLRSPCEGGGTCESHDGTFTCYCTKERTGKYCERLLEAAVTESVAGFSGQSRVTLINSNYKQLTPKYSVSFKFKPLSGEGVIVHSGDTMLALHNGHLQFSYNSLVVQSSYPLTLNTWHEVNLQTYHADVMMQVQGERLMGRLEQGRIDALMETVYIGGLGPITTQSPLPGYTGCVAEMMIDNNHVSLTSSLQMGDTSITVTEAEAVMDCGDVTANLMVSDQADNEDNNQDNVFVFDEDRTVKIMNRVTRRLFNEKRSVIQFELKTRDTDGTILSIGDNTTDMFTVSVSKGHLQVSLAINSQPRVKQSKIFVNDGGWRQVSIERSGGHVLVRLDRTRDIFSMTVDDSDIKEARTLSLKSNGDYILGENLQGSIRNLKIKDRTVTSANVLL